MYEIQNLTADSRQKQTLILPDSTQIVIEIYYVPMQLGWFITNLTYGAFTLNGFRITNSPDMLYQYRNILPFGLACLSSSRREPTLQDDFLSGASKLYVLTEAEVEQFAEFLSG